MARSNLEMPRWPEETPDRPPAITPGGILDGLARYPSADGLNLVLSANVSSDLPWTVREGGMQQPVMPTFRDPIPPAPPGVSVDENILRAQQFKSPWWKPAKLAKYELMLDLFPTGHEMDYKKIDGKYRDFGNFNYGAFGSALGLSPYELHSGAGYQQLKDKHWEVGYGVPGLVPPFGDNDADYKQIDAGIRYYQAHRPKK
ncbi:MAG TPA: polymorphic toxin type 44 domain-containing protein [Rhizomicrobium sp.]|nr:polymorphic toxin type 44 domain-containing protein [Rhizomicrobium sp.]